MAARIMASDFDGTLRHYNAPHPYVGRDDMEAIAAFREHGNLFGMCSGRALDSILKASVGMPPSDFYIVSSGAVYAEPSPNGVKIVSETEIPRSLARDLYGHLCGHRIFYVHLNGILYRVGKKESGEHAQVFVDSFDDLPEGRIHQVSAGTASSDTAFEAVRQLKKIYGRKLAVYQNNDHIDITDKTCSKGTGIGELRKRTGGKMLIGGIGDSFNDIPLLKAADVAFTFRFSPAKVKAEADYVVDSAAEALGILESLQ
jgi:HAD superfamily hydrolase (TIGR01484 family)